MLEGARPTLPDWVGGMKSVRRRSPPAVSKVVVFEDFALGGDLPEAVFGASEEGREAGTGGEGGPAEPVDGAGAGEECGGFSVGEDGVVFDAGAGLGRVVSCFCGLHVNPLFIAI
jgi:hypothetical protein